MKIPFNRPVPNGNELAYIAQVLEGAKWSGDGPFSTKCEDLLRALTDSKRALLTTSCTDALEMSAILLDIGPGDEVICPSFTFVSSVNAFVLRGAIPKFVDIRSDTLNINEDLIEQQITEKTKAIVVVHYAGIPCEMDKINSIAKKYGIAVIEDAAHGLFGSYKGRRIGSMGRFATLSFHETKNIPAGEAGALLINLESDVSRAEIIREKGTNRKRFFRGEVDKYTWVDVGSSFLPSEIVAAVLLAQLEKHGTIQTVRRHAWDRYFAELKFWAEDERIQLPSVPTDCSHPSHLFYLIGPSARWRSGLIEHLRAHGVQATFHYQSLHLSEMGARFHPSGSELPVTERASDCLVRLPLFNDLTDGLIDHIVHACTSYRGPRV